MGLWRKDKKTYSPDLTLKSVWDAYTKTPAANAAADHQFIFNCLLNFNATAKDGIINELLQIEADSMHTLFQTSFLMEVPYHQPNKIFRSAGKNV